MLLEAKSCRLTEIHKTADFLNSTVFSNKLGRWIINLIVSIMMIWGCHASKKLCRFLYLVSTNKSVDKWRFIHIHKKTHVRGHFFLQGVVLVLWPGALYKIFNRYRDGSIEMVLTLLWKSVEFRMNSTFIFLLFIL